MLKDLMKEELVVLEELIKEADDKYHKALKGGGIVSASLFEWKDYLNLRYKYLTSVVAKLNLIKD